MHLQTLNPSNYKRLFAFGCSFTRYYWPTWADILAEDIPYYENWGWGGAGNLYIFNAIMEAHNRHKFTKDDLIVVMWSNKNREDRYVNNQWLVTPGSNLEKTYGAEWVKKFYDDRGCMIRDLAILQSTQLFLDTLDCDWINMSINTFANGDLAKIKATAPQYISGKADWNQEVIAPLHRGVISDLFINLDVIDCYKNVFLKLQPSVFNILQDTTKYKAHPRPNDGDGHPTPFEILTYLDLIFPGNTISNNARLYALTHEQQVWKGKIEQDTFESKSVKVVRL
jgi:hypothetical protein